MEKKRKEELNQWLIERSRKFGRPVEYGFPNFEMISEMEPEEFIEWADETNPYKKMWEELKRSCTDTLDLEKLENLKSLLSNIEKNAGIFSDSF